MGLLAIVGHHLGRAGRRVVDRVRLLGPFLLESYPRLLFVSLAVAYLVALLFIPVEEVTRTRSGVLLLAWTVYVLAVATSQFVHSKRYQQLAKTEGDSLDAYESFLYDAQTGQVIDEERRASADDDDSRTARSSQPGSVSVGV